MLFLLPFLGMTTYPNSTSEYVCLPASLLSQRPPNNSVCNKVEICLSLSNTGPGPGSNLGRGEQLPKGRNPGPAACCSAILESCLHLRAPKGSLPSSLHSNQGQKGVLFLFKSTTPAPCTSILLSSH